MNLIVRQSGKEIARLELEPGMEYFAGRASDCAIRLEGEKAISRQHIKFFEKDGVWVAQLLSRFGGLIYEGEAVQVLELTPGASFLVPPYEFIVESAAVSTPAPSLSSSRQGPVENSLVLHSAAQTPRDEEPDTFAGNIEATSAGVALLQPYLKVHYGSTQKGEVFRLEGNVWIAGRDPNSEIFLDDRHISRRHFELSRTNEGIFITDLESANGTAVNGESLSPHEPCKLLSGDKITIMDVEIDFEVRDTQFDAKLVALPEMDLNQSTSDDELDVSIPQFPQPYQNSPGPMMIPRVEKSAPVPKLNVRGFDFKKHRIRIAFGAVVLVLIAILSSGGNKKTKPQETTSTSTSPDTTMNFDKLTEENKSSVRDTFNLARNLYLTGKYELCLQELKKLHNLVPFYENSKELVTLCVQGADFAKMKADLDYKQQEKLRREREIQTLTDTCQEKVNRNPNLPEAELQACLAPAIELDPENVKVVELTNLLKMRQQEREDRAKNQAQHQERLRQANAIYLRAKQKLKAGRLRDALDEYEKLLTGNYPEASTLKSEAQREVSSVRKELDEKVSRLLVTCQENIDKAHFRAAYDACRNAGLEDPKNVQGQSLMKHALSEMRREMKAIYEDSVLEESLGNIDAAKEKWKRLMQEDLPSDDYYTKSKLKLQKYGVGI